jgi:hypothetical protein
MESFASSCIRIKPQIVSNDKDTRGARKLILEKLIPMEPPVFRCSHSRSLLVSSNGRELSHAVTQILRAAVDGFLNVRIIGKKNASCDELTDMSIQLCSRHLTRNWDRSRPHFIHKINRYRKSFPCHYTFAASQSAFKHIR